MSFRPSFAVVAMAVTILAILGGLIEWVRPLLPAPAPNRSLENRGDYLAQGDREGIGWQPLSDAPFLTAAGLKKPVLLLAGAAWTKDGRLGDKLAFGDPELENLAGKDFEPVRVDLDESPEWLNAYFPLQRSEDIDLQPGFQVYFLNPDGRMYGYETATTLADQQDSAVVSDILLANRSAFYSMATGVNAVQARNLADLNQLMSPPANFAPNFPGEAIAIRDRADEIHGGFPLDGVQLPKPDAWRFLLSTGDLRTVGATLDPVLRSPLVDWLNGGFFRRADSLDWKQIEFDKVAVANADLTWLVAQYAALVGSSFDRAVAEAAFDSLTGEFERDRDLLVSCRVGDEDALDRSRHASFSPRDFRLFWNSGLLSGEDRLWAIKNLNLDPRQNPQLTVWVSKDSVLQDPMFPRVLSILRRAKERAPARYGSVAYGDVNGYVCARLLQCARLWNDPRRMQAAEELRGRLESFRSGQRVDHRLRQLHGFPELTDYLGYADAAMEDYLATGNGESLENGLAVLLEAKRTFELEVPGAWLMAKGSPEGLPKDYLTPELVDNLYESCTAREIRLMWDYARLLAGNESHANDEQILTDGAKAALKQFAGAAATIGVGAAGYYAAALRLEDPEFAVAVGPRAVELASQLARACPTRLCAPAAGPVRPDLQKRAPGVYLVSGNEAKGPYSAAEAARLLPSAYAFPSSGG